MKKFLALALLIPTFASAQFVDGNKLYQLMISDADTRVTAHWFVAGVVDTVDEVLICAPGNVRLGQLTDMVQKTLVNEPDKRHLGANILVIYSLSKTFPCKQKPPQSKTL